MVTTGNLRLISMRISDDLLKRVDALAGAQHITRSAAIESLLASAIEDTELSVRMMTDPVVGRAILGAIATPEVLRALTAAMRSELTDDQLQLFSRSMATLDQQLAKQKNRPTPATAPAGTLRRSRPSAKQRGKRGKV